MTVLMVRLPLAWLPFIHSPFVHLPSVRSFTVRSFTVFFRRSFPHVHSFAARLLTFIHVRLPFVCSFAAHMFVCCLFICRS